MKNLVIYHGGCYDGFTSAWVAHKFFNGNCTLYPGKYGEPPPHVDKTTNVYIVDFSYPREVMLDLHAKSHHLVVLDHHKTAMKDCEGLDFCIFDMDKSGCKLTWEYFFSDRPAPLLVEFVEDRDLWRFKLKDTKRFMSYLSSMEMELGVWNAIAEAGPVEMITMLTEGAAIERYVNNLYEKLAKEARLQYFWVGGELATIAAVNAPYQLASGLCNYILSNENQFTSEKDPLDFVVAYFQTENMGWSYSLRSKGEFDVSEVAKMHGGGGHKNAAGFRSNYLVFEGDGASDEN